MKKIILWSTAIIGLATITSLVFLNKPAGSRLKSKAETPVEAKVQAAIQPPVPGKQTPFASYRISVKNGGVIHYPTGSSVTIPANAFAAAKGNPLSDSIDIKYREFHNPLEIFLSGIPMQYDSAGLSRTLESAGMIEILAFDKELPLHLNAQTPIQIKMASDNNETRFNLYELDTLHNNWVYKGKDRVEPIKEFTSVRHPEPKNETEKSVTATNSIKPAMANPQSYSFKIGYDKEEFPELAAYENVLFEVTGTNFKSAYYKINWNKISLYSGDAPGLYIIKLKKADTTISVTAKPVFDKNDYAMALTKFEEHHRQASAERDEKEFEKQAELNKVNQTLAGYSNNKMTAAVNTMFRMNAYRSFPVGSLGIHNCDFPIPPILQYAFSFSRNAKVKKAAAADNALTYSTIFLVEKGKNTVFRFAKGEPVKCNPTAKNLMWTMTDNNAVAFFRIADYNTLTNGADNNITPVLAKSQGLAFEEIKKFSE